MVLDLPDKKRPAPSVQAMERWIHDAQKQTGIAPKRLGWIVATTVVVAALQRALEGDSPLFFAMATDRSAVGGNKTPRFGSSAHHRSLYLCVNGVPAPIAFAT